MIRRPPRSTLSSSSAASDVYKRQQRRVRGIFNGCDAVTPVTVIKTCRRLHSNRCFGACAVPAASLASRNSVTLTNLPHSRVSRRSPSMRRFWRAWPISWVLQRPARGSMQ
eukprot:TRINITY_DN28622_c0_g1_i1.p2 TRINITY_DN28622_c0_g1~~TRINITY_DN28622_c0_g1_i1.p2  ORF type:complete len:111 (+),score=16.04 TRINITY_DN28622_c0_g1_i1:46-378(+)